MEMLGSIKYSILQIISYFFDESESLDLHFHHKILGKLYLGFPPNLNDF